TSAGTHPVVIYVQPAEGMTVDMKRQKSRTETFNYFDLYREKLPEMNVAFFSYEGRGIRMGDKPPRYETINWDIYNTSTLDNKVRDVMSAVELIKKQPGIDASRIFLIGASEGALLAAEAAARLPQQIRGQRGRDGSHRRRAETGRAVKESRKIKDGVSLLREPRSLTEYYRVFWQRNPPRRAQSDF